MSLLSVIGISYRYSSTVELFRELSFSVDAGDRLAIVGVNGAGKSTLLRVLAGELDPADGAVARRKDLRIATAHQQQASRETLLFDYIFDARPALARLRLKLLETEHSLPLEYAALVNEYAEAGGYAAEAASEAALDGLGFAPAEWRLPLLRLSGGQRTRAGLAWALHTDADLLLLDEPTNHLDIAARRWLEKELAGRRGACILVSHDRTMLRNVATRVLEIERGRARVYTGGYDSYRRQREVAERQAWENYDAFERRKAAAEQAAERRSRLAVQVATAPAGARSSHDFYRRKAAKVARTARLLRERADHGPRIDKPWEEQPIPALDFGGVKRSGDIALTVIQVTKSFAAKALFRDVSFELPRGSRLAITGPNGAGKTTLLRLILGLDRPDHGCVRLGAHVTVGHYAQDAENLERSATPLEICGAGTLSRTMLGCLKVRPDRVDQPLAEASAGECAKVALARLLISGANLLVLDEPTNHLDIEAQEALERTLAEYPGTIVVVSHDRAFLEALEPDRVLELGNSADARATRECRPDGRRG